MNATFFCSQLDGAASLPSGTSYERHLQLVNAEVRRRSRKDDSDRMTPTGAALLSIATLIDARGDNLVAQVQEFAQMRSTSTSFRLPAGHSLREGLAQLFSRAFEISSSIDHAEVMISSAGFAEIATADENEFYVAGDDFRPPQEMAVARSFYGPALKALAEAV